MKLTKRSIADADLLKFRRIEAWSMRELGFTFKEIGEELKVKMQGAHYLVNQAIKNNEVPPSDEYCEDIAPQYAAFVE